MVSAIKEWIAERNLDVAYNRIVNKIFEGTLNKDVERKKSFDGYPSQFLKQLDSLSRRSGVNLVDHERSDYTLDPLLRQYSYLYGGRNGTVYKALQRVNMKLYGGFLTSTKLSEQLKVFRSYVEFTDDFSAPDILDLLLPREMPHYLRKILFEFKEDVNRGGKTFKGFVNDNPYYFKEILAHFPMDNQELSDIQCLNNAIEELENQASAKKNRWLIVSTFISSLIDIVVLIVSFGKKIIPEIIESFDAKLSEFSAPVRLVYRCSEFLTSKWYLALAIASILYLATKSKIVELTKGYLAFKISFTKNYVVNEQLLRFLKTYKTMMRSKDWESTFKHSVGLIDNAYLNFIMSRYIDGGEKDINNTAVSLCEILSEIPYIPQEYLDILSESELLGESERGIDQVIKLMEPRVEKASKQVNKTLMAIAVGTSLVIVVYLCLKIFSDLRLIINRSETEFIDRLKN